MISTVPYSYTTIKVTQSRIDKGLLAIPVSLIDLFPKNAKEIILINETGKEEVKNFTPYRSSSNECRIGGLKEFFNNHKIKDGDEIVIQFLDDDKYKLFPERIFEKQIIDLENKFEESTNESEADNTLNQLSLITKINPQEVLRNEFVRLSIIDMSKRKLKETIKSKINETVPVHLRKILLGLYEGKCQVSGFTFIMKNGTPYFEIHHIDPSIGNHFKNLLVVCPNVHAQFTYANLEQYFDKEGWLKKVMFNTESFAVHQAIDALQQIFEKEIHF